MQALCQWEVQADETPRALAVFFADEDAPTEVATYATRLVKAFWNDRSRVDEWIGAASEHWGLARMSPVVRNAMRVAIVEMVGRDVPRKVALNEAIEIGREYGGVDSPRFINGVLDEVLKRIEAEA